MNKYSCVPILIIALALLPGLATSQTVVLQDPVPLGVTEQGIMTNFTKLEISPQFLNFMLKPGESKEMTVTIKNKEKQAVSVTPLTVLMPYGGYNVDPEWISVNPENAEIPAGGSQKFTIKVTVPNDASIGNSGVQIAFTNETMPTPYPLPIPSYIHALQLSLDIWTNPKIQIITPYINDMLEAGKEYDFEIKLKNIGKEPININPKISSDNNRFNGGMMPVAFSDDSITITAPSNVPAGATEIVKLHIKVPVDAKGSYNGAINLNIDDSSIQEWAGMVQISFNVWTQPSESFVKTFNLKKAAPLTIEISSSYGYSYLNGMTKRAKQKEPSFETTLIGPAGNADLTVTKKVIKSGVNMGGQMPPWELDSKGIYQENGVQIIETYKANGSEGEWKLKVMPNNTESFEYSITIGE